MQPANKFRVETRRRMTGSHLCPRCKMVNVPDSRHLCYFCTRTRHPWTILRRDDPDLGPMRFCRRCAEWWPLDDEFYYRDRRKFWVCRACQTERSRIHHAKRRAKMASQAA